jgi:hypothetical protein
MVVKLEVPYNAGNLFTNKTTLLESSVLCNRCFV